MKCKQSFSQSKLTGCFKNANVPFIISAGLLWHALPVKLDIKGQRCMANKHRPVSVVVLDNEKQCGCASDQRITQVRRGAKQVTGNNWIEE